MHIHRVKSKRGDKVYTQILLRESYRERGEHGSKVKKRTLLNLTKYPESVISAIELALKHKDNLPELEHLLGSSVKHTQGRSVGALWVLLHVCRDLGLDKIIGSSRHGLLCLWMIMARLIEQGSRLSAVRLADEHAVCELLGVEPFTEDDLYRALDWLCEQQDSIEQKLFKKTYGEKAPNLFLYDVTSSYLEGEQNELGDWGYNRDKKRGKKQIVIGLLCSDDGTPVSVRVFKGNTNDLKTFGAQIEKTAEEFGCRQVTMVGDRGMIKSAQVEELKEAGFHYITAITKPQIRAMLSNGVLQLGLFDSDLCEVEHEGIRYILRRNPIRAAELAGSRDQRIKVLQAYAEQKNRYLAEHPRADFYKATQKVWEKESKLQVSDFVTTTCKDRIIRVEIDGAYLAEVEELDGCYALKTDLAAEYAPMEIVHDRYKDLTQVEQAFRTCKTGHLEVRPLYVRKESRTRGHVFVVMLAYLIRRKLADAWRDLDVTVEEGLKKLSTLCAMEHEINGNQTGGMLSVPQPRPSLARLFSALTITPPSALPRRTGHVDSRRKLPSRRKSK
ncbi:IS1634 family transposase [Desulfofustis glycolicus]|uniref:Transposase n=8 Tax=Desulfofustis glycolicus DSM 9705 TaxID=1121409 RepID=A0A1M5YX55_9BACT|nr:IS1634 family transposase [Desulfofustis glycolicus]SHI16438.1 Transposase [Desulfofustis glycolicus DSM 9705]